MGVFFSIEDCYDLDIKYRKLIQDDCKLLTCEQSFSKVLVRVGQGEKINGSKLTVLLKRSAMTFN